MIKEYRYIYRIMKVDITCIYLDTKNYTWYEKSIKLKSDPWSLQVDRYLEQIKDLI